MRMTEDPRRFFFVHVMKTGGTTLALHMAREFEPTAMYPNESLDRRHASDVASYMSVDALLQLPPERKMAIRAYTGHFPYMVREQLGLELETLTLLRDPVDRSVSALKHFKRLYERYHACSLEEIYDDAFVFRHFVHNHQTKVFAVTAEDRPEALASRLTQEQLHAYLDGRAADPYAASAAAADTIEIDDDRLALAKSRLGRIEVIGLSERFGDFVEELRRRYGWWPAGLSAEARANVSAESWDAGPALRARIAHDNRFDLELYERARELVAERGSSL
jgi:Sulfotransferase family